MPRGAEAQGAVDPSVAPRAAALERSGDWQAATQMLGSYLATAPGDGAAWLQFGRMYLIAAQEWHRGGHTGSPDGSIYLDLAAIAFDHALDLQVDSGFVYRGAVEMERGVLVMEQVGWTGLRGGETGVVAASVPGFVLELGINLLNSCPQGGILVPGSDLESLSAWLASVALDRRGDIFPLLTERFESDSLYRRQAMVALGVPGTVAPGEALVEVAARRTLCLTPFADSIEAPVGPWTVTRLVRIAGPDTVATADPLGVTELLRVSSARPSPWAVEVQSVYLEAARRNVRLCGGLLAFLGDPAASACGR